MIKNGDTQKPIKLLVYSVAIALVSGSGTYALLSATLKYDALTIRLFANIVGLSAAFIVLRRHHPLNIFSRINVGYTLKYLAPAWVLSIILAGFPYSIWLGRNVKVPKEYHVFMGADVIEKIIFFCSLCVLGPFIEEVIFRGYIYRFSKEEYGVWPGVIMTTILFSIFHGGANLFSIQIAIISLIAIYSYEESGSIMGSIAYHIFHNTVWFLLVIIGMYYQANGTP